MRAALLILFAGSMCAQTLDDAMRALAQRVSAHLAPAETAQLTVRNRSMVSPADAAKVQAAFDRALRKRVRNPMPVDVTMTISENARGYLAVVEVRHGNDRAVEMAGFTLDASKTPPRASVGIEKKLVWDQEARILDVVAMGERTLVLDVNGVSRYERRDRKEFSPIAVMTRDPRGRIDAAGDSLTVQVPGSVCRGALAMLTCEPGGEFIGGRNTLEGQVYSRARIGNQTIAAELDGRVHVYDEALKPLAVFDGWGSDFALVCGGTWVAASAAATESIAIYNLLNNAPVRVSDPVEFAGPVTALWARENGALAVIRNQTSGRYEAYSLTVDCGH
jgi:hypothetical protein